MTQKKNGFLNFCFSLLPGAGQMYQGYMKRGVSVMTLFFGWLCVVSYVRLDGLLFFVPVIWFFGFFDALHHNTFSDLQRQENPDEFLFIDNSRLDKAALRKLRIPVAIVLLIVGVYGLMRMGLNLLIDCGILSWESNWVGLVYDSFPEMVFAGIIILIGVYLIFGKHEEIRDEKNEEIYEKMNQENWEAIKNENRESRKEENGDGIKDEMYEKMKEENREGIKDEIHKRMNEENQEGIKDEIHEENQDKKGEES